jgi:hypothetical protein
MLKFKQIITSTMRLVIILFVICLSVFSAQAQKTTPKGKGTTPTASKTTPKVSPADAAAINEIKKTFKTFIDAYSVIEKTKDKEGVLKYMSPDVVSTLVSFNIADKMGILYSDYKGFSMFLDKLISTEGLEVAYNLSNIDKVYVNGNIGIVVYGVNYEVIRSGNVWARGHETVSLTYKKMQGEWKIIQYTVTAIEDETLKVSCPCDLTTEKGEFLLKTTIPNGRSFRTELNPVGFITPQNDMIIVIGDKYYKWKENGDVNYMQEANTTEGGIIETTIGSITDKTRKKDVLTLIIKTHLYKETCNEMQMTVDGKKEN